MSYLDTLGDLVDIAFRMAKSNLERTGSVDGFFVLHYPDGRTEELHVPADCGAILNSFRSKEILFRFIRMIVEAKGADAVILASDTWHARTTPKANEIPREELDRLLQEREYTTAVQLGFAVREERILVLLQDRDEMRMVSQPYRRKGDGRRIAFCGARDVQTVPLAAYTGATKMFGELYPISPESEQRLNELLGQLFGKEAASEA